MKKIGLLLASILFSSVMFAQTIATPTDNLRLILKSVQKVGNDVELTGIVTNCSKQEIVLNLVGGQYQTGMVGSVAYDNEGNIYELGDMLVAVGKKAYTEQYCGVSIPSGVGIKCRFCVKNVDPAATELSKIKICVLCTELMLDSTGICFELNNIRF